MVLICEVTSANPNTGLEYLWSLNGTGLNETFVKEISIQEGLKSKIIIPVYDHELFGTWTCSVRNTVGQTDPNCTLFVDAPLGEYCDTIGKVLLVGVDVSSTFTILMPSLASFGLHVCVCM